MIRSRLEKRPQAKDAKPIEHSGRLADDVARTGRRDRQIVMEAGETRIVVY